MKKRMLLAVLVVLFGLVLFACKPADPTVPTEPTVPTVPTEPTTPTLTAITFSGIASTIQDIEFEAEFNVLDGITATGNDGLSYTSQITYSSISTISAQHMLDTTKTGPVAIRYTVQVGTVLAQVWRYLNVLTPERPDDALIVNGDFTQGTAFWDDGANGFFVADGAALTLTVEDGALKAEVVSGSNLWTPRFGQQMVPFEQGKAYKVQFDAKSSVPKTINVQVGELISMDPWFRDFKPGQTEHHALTTEWATYEFSFMMNTDNPRGGVLFEMGTLNGQDIDATIWFDNIIVTETTIGEDTVKPSISGVRASVQLMVDDVYNPLTGVSALDNIDGDLTDDIDVEIFLVEGETETPADAVDTSKEGTYRIVYTVSDAAGNVQTAESTVEIILILVESYPGWRAFLNDWDGTAGELVVSDGELNLNLTAINVSEGWNIQVIQDGTSLYGMADNTGHMTLVEGKTYRVTFDAKATVAGEIKVAVGHSTAWVPYFESAMTAITTEMATYTFTFTLDDETKDYSVPAQFKIEMGMLFAGQTAPQSFTLDNVKIEVEEGEAFVATDLIFNGTMDEEVIDLYDLPEWRSFVNAWEGTVGNLFGKNGELVLEVSNINAMNENWKIQVIQDAFALGTGEDNVGHMLLEAGKTYRVSFDAKASVAGSVTLAIGHAGGGWTPYFVDTFDVSTDMTPYTFTFTLDNVEADYSVPAQFKLEMGLLFASVASGSFTLDHVKMDVLDGENYVNANQIVNGNMVAPFSYQIEEWRAFVNAWEGTAGSIIGKNNELILQVSNISSMNENWKIQVIQDAFALGTGADNVGHMLLEAGKTYRVTFDAKASVAGDVNLAIGHAGGGWTPYFMEVFGVTETFAPFTFDFTLDDETADYSVLAQFKLEMGLLFAGQETGEFYLRNVKFEVLEGEAYVDAEVIVNGTFEKPASYELNDWRAFVNSWEGTAGVHYAQGGELILEVNAINAMDANWKIQVIQDATAISGAADNTGHMQFEEGKTYRVTFNARASVEGEVNLAIGHAGGGWTPYFMEVFNVTKDMQSYTFTFTLDDETADYSVLAQFKLEMGLLFAGQDTPSFFALDNVLIEVLDGENYVNANLIENGAMDYIEPVVE